MEKEMVIITLERYEKMVFDLKQAEHMKNNKDDVTEVLVAELDELKQFWDAVSRARNNCFDYEGQRLELRDFGYEVNKIYSTAVNQRHERRLRENES